MNRTWTYCWPICLLAALLLPSPAAAQGHKQTPSKRTVPRWPQRPDPVPLSTRAYLKLTLRLEHGTPSLRKTARGAFKRAQVIQPRFDGRFAVELFAGKVLLDVIRFDFPLAAAVGEPGRASKLPLAAGVRAETTVAVPYTDRLTHARLLDTKTRKSYPLALPLKKPPETLAPASEALRLSTFRKRGTAGPPPAEVKQRRRKPRKPDRSR